MPMKGQLLLVSRLTFYAACNIMKINLDGVVIKAGIAFMGSGAR